MAKWRKLALENLPDLRREIENPDSNIYLFFSELLLKVRTAHREVDTAALQKIYGFAEWCMRHHHKFLWNAVGVAFYEHLIDDEATQAAIPQWVPPDIYAKVECLWEARMEKEDFEALRQSYRNRK